MSGAPTFLALPARQPKPQAPLLPPARAHMLLDPVILGHHPRCQHALHQRTPSSQIRTPYSCAGVEVMGHNCCSCVSVYKQAGFVHLASL